jgi:predicted metal-dependent HD superfamily phosphohydrolase
VQEYDTLIACYAEPHRAYHTRQHLEECLTQLDQVRAQCAHPDEVALALWYHDAIYKPRRSDNEALSADWLVRVAKQVCSESAAVERMRRLVLATRHDAVPSAIDEQILVDVDLSVLGAAPSRFDEYEQQVRREYRWVPQPLYVSARAKILRSFNDRPRIYSTGYFFQRFETQARANLARSLSDQSRTGMKVS